MPRPNSESRLFTESAVLLPKREGPVVVAVPDVVVVGGKVPKREGVEVEEVDAGPENDIVRAGRGG